MKCVCGYEQAKPFNNYVRKEPVFAGGHILKLENHENLYICPACGTVKFSNVVEECQDGKDCDVSGAE